MQDEALPKGERLMRSLVLMFLIFATVYPANLWLCLIIEMGSPQPHPIHVLMGFALASIPVLLSSLVAASHRTGIAIAFCVVSLAVNAVGPLFCFIGALVGGVSAIGVVALRSRSPHPWPSMRRLGFASTVAVTALIALSYFGQTDRYERPDPLPAELSQALGPDAAAVRGFYRYDLGGFMDWEQLWRIDAPRSVLDRVIENLGLHPVPKAPSAFWRMPPHYWPRALPAAGELFQSNGFPGTGRGPDGWHCFLLFDARQERTFIWIKDNMD